MESDLDITPEPSPAEEEAIRWAVAQLSEGEGGHASAWWRTGVRESVLGEDSEEGAPEG